MGAQFEDFQFWIQYIPTASPGEEGKIVRIKRCVDNPANTLIFKVPPPEDTLPFIEVGNYNIRLWVEFKKRFNSRVRVADLEFLSEYHAVGTLFGSRVAWL